jgi:hypothetical protein
MKILTFLGVLALLTTSCSPGQLADTEQSCEALFVQSADGMSFDGTRLTLAGADQNLTWFCDRPFRQAGHITWESLMELGGTAGDSFAKDKPNAAVSIFDLDGEITDAVVELTGKPRMSGGDAVYSVAVLEGELPQSGGSTVIFIDPIGMPMTPTSRAGVRRRVVRRNVIRR